MNLNKIVKLFNILREPYYLQALLKNSPAGTEHQKLLKQFSFSFIVDIGANRGQFALAARKCFPGAIIHSVEPLREPAEIFSRVFAGDPKVFLHNCAIGSQKATKIIHVSQQDDSSSLLPIGDRQIKLFPDTKEKETREISVLPLADVIDIETIPPTSLLKIDVQGYELETLKGCAIALHKHSHIYIECSFVELYIGQALAYEIIEFLSEMNFKLIGIYNTHYDSQGKAIQADFFFENKLHT